MLAIDLQFIAGRFHATPWGNSPNEGVPEWPPSPWRLARALVSTALGKAQGAVDQDTVLRLCHVLAIPPLVHLPPASVGHVRHYLPLYGHDVARGQTKSSLVFDTFVAVDPVETLTLYWPDLTVPDDDVRSLDLLLARLDYLGRSESWVRCHARADGPVLTVNCMPLADEEPHADGQIVRLLSPGSSCTLDELTVETTDVQRQKRPLPAGAVEVSFVRPFDCFAVHPGRAAMAQVSAPQLAVFLLDGPVLPSAKDTLLVADLFRKTAIRNHSTPSLQLSGKDDAGVPVEGHHHMYVLPSDEDSDGLLDHIFVFVHGGMEPDTLRALADVRRLYRRDQDFAVVFLGSGEVQDVTSPSLAAGVVWESATPFLPMRHTKLRGTGEDRHFVDTDGDQLLQELHRQHFPAPRSVEPMQAALIGSHVKPWYDFHTTRGDRGAVGHPCGFRITFPTEVQGPVVLGGQAHFGMGRFVVVSSKRRPDGTV
jgi:CRISPR-associated protein Csb2